MKKIFSIILAATAILPGTGMNAATTASGDHCAQKLVGAQQVYRIDIVEAGDSALTFDKPDEMVQRGLFQDIWKTMRQSYAGTLQGQIATTSADILSSAVGLLVETLRSKKTDWYRQAQKECTFKKELPMTREAHDFYAKASKKGALDPQDLLFNGFSCTQYYTYKDEKGETVTVPALLIKCSLRRDEHGRNRILHHGKFEVEIDQLYLNPALCNLPNDSVTAANYDLRTPFDFNRRKNLNLNLNARLSSSWINEAIQVVNDQQLGEFNISVNIPDSTALCKEGLFAGWYVYDRNNLELSKAAIAAKAVPVVFGESFIVPRSFTGTLDGENYERVWGTGQYKIDMTLSEKCEVNLPAYYEPKKNREGKNKAGKPDSGTMSAMAPQMAKGMPAKFGPDRDHKWNRYWSEEWNKMKRRRKSQGFWRGILDRITMNYKEGRWIYTLTQPVIDAVLVDEKNAVNPLISKMFGLDESAPATGGAPQGQPGKK